jgi:hypothetical protein
MGIPRGWKNADAVAAMRDFLSQPPPRRAAIRDLIAEIHSGEPFICRCAADLARRISAREPGILGRYAGRLIDLIAQLQDGQWQTRGYLVQAAAPNAQTHQERMRLAALLRPMVQDQRIAVRAIALEALGIVAVAEPKLRHEVLPLLENASRDGISSMRLRARRVLPAVLESAARSHPRPQTVK